MANPPKELNAALLRSLPDQGPVVMVNLVRFKERSDDGDGSGRDAYERYSRAVVPPLLRPVGGTVLWAGQVEAPAFGDPDAAYWDHVVLVWYPSRRAFLDMVTSVAYAEANVHRENGVADHVILATTQTYSKIPAAK
jgi:uncharacterized protein (DUF1330 family)